MRSATLLRIAARCPTGVLPHASAAACAASSARLMSSSVERATWQNTLPFTGEGLSKYWPFTGGTNLPPMKLS